MISLWLCSLFVVSPLVATFVLVSLLPSIKLSKALSKLFHTQVTLKWNADPGPHLMSTPQFLSSSIFYSHQWIFSPSTFVVSSGDEISGWRGGGGVGGCWGTHPFPGPGQWTSASPPTSRGWECCLRLWHGPRFLLEDASMSYRNAHKSWHWTSQSLMTSARTLIIIVSTSGEGKVNYGVWRP